MASASKPHGLGHGQCHRKQTAGASHLGDRLEEKPPVGLVTAYASGLLQVRTQGKGETVG